MPNPKRNPQVDQYLKYSGMAFQLAAVLAVGVWAGTRIDQYFQTDRPYFTALLALLSLFAGLYISLKDLIFGRKPPEEKEK